MTMSTRTEAIVKPELLVWAREEAGASIEEAAKKVRVKPERLASWEAGERRPTVHQLRKLGQAYKRPIAVFFLPRPPKHFQAMHDFRRLPGEVAGHESYHLRLDVRRARYRRDIALDLFRQLEEEPPTFSSKIALSDDPESAALETRRVLGIDAHDSPRWRDPHDALNGWRQALEDQGILVFQTSGVDLAEARGFSIAERPLPVIAVNGKDSPRGRIFSMVHELAHIMLSRDGLCDMREDEPRPVREQEVEVFCNRFAGAVLVPAEMLLGTSIVRRHGRSDAWSNDELGQLSRQFRASRETVLRRLLVLGRTSQSFYSEKRRQFLAEYEKNRQTSKGGPSPDRLAVSRAGSLFTRLVLNSYYNEKITSSRVSDYLEVRLKHMPKIEQAVLGHPGEFGAFM